MSFIGSTVGGRYKVIKHAGRGGMQEVFLAKDTLLDLDVALKTPQAGQANTRFRKSALVSARVNHHNVAKTLDYFEEGGNQYLIEEFVDGETLDDKLDIFGFLDPHLGARVLHHLSKGVAASHRAGVVHRDLKPSNVMITKGVNVHQLKITDFGIATLTQEVFDDEMKAGDVTQTKSGTLKGAIPFMAPEMMFRKPNEHPGASVDVWSLGAMMFKLLTGEYPFGVFLEAAANVKNNDRKPWPAFMTKKPQFSPLSKELQAIVDSCLTPDIALRPTADQLIQQCEKLCYLSVDRRVGRVESIRGNGYFGFIDGEDEDAFFHIDSAYGTNLPQVDTNICYSTFPGTPKSRAHPVVIIR